MSGRNGSFWGSPVLNWNCNCNCLGRKCFWGRRFWFRGFFWGELGWSCPGFTVWPRGFRLRVWSTRSIVYPHVFSFSFHYLSFYFIIYFYTTWYLPIVILIVWSQSLYYKSPIATPTAPPISTSTTPTPHSSHNTLTMGFAIRKPDDAVGSATPAIVIGLFVAFGGVLFGYVIILLCWNYHKDEC